MKKNVFLVGFFLTIFSTVQAQPAASQPRGISFSGYYHSRPDSATPFKYYLRFYADGTVIGVTTAGNPKNLLPWFTKDHKTVSRGQYSVSDTTLHFTMKSDEGEVAYKGALLPGNRLTFTVKSLINKYEGKEDYFFMEMDGMK